MFIQEPSHDKTNKVTFEPIEDSDQPGHPGCLGCPGWSKSSLVYVILLVLSCYSPYLYVSVSVFVRSAIQRRFRKALFSFLHTCICMVPQPMWILKEEFCLCWGLTSQSTFFQSCRDEATASWVINQYFPGVKCERRLAEDWVCCQEI